MLSFTHRRRHLSTAFVSQARRREALSPTLLLVLLSCRHQSGTPLRRPSTTACRRPVVTHRTSPFTIIKNHDSTAMAQVRFSEFAKRVLGRRASQLIREEVACFFEDLAW